MNRIPVPRPRELRSDAAKLVAAIAQPGREPAKTMAVLARQPDLLAPFLGWAAALALNGVLRKIIFQQRAKLVFSFTKEKFIVPQSVVRIEGNDPHSKPLSLGRGAFAWWI